MYKLPVTDSAPAGPAGAFLHDGGACSLCPRSCGVFRPASSPAGFCASPMTMSIARAAVHYGEEPCLSGVRGSGAVFFSGCNLRCVYCQNHRISGGDGGTRVSVKKLQTILLRLEDEGVHNIDLVTPSHYTPLVAEALAGIKLGIPVIWNSSAYERPEVLRQLEGLVQIYLPDYKYADDALARELSAAPDYRERALSAIREMYRQTGSFVVGTDGLLSSGVIVRHLILPGHSENTLRVIDSFEDELPWRGMMFSLLAQYTPVKALVDTPAFRAHPELCRTVSPDEYQRILDYLDFSPIEEGYIQDLSSATEEAIPEFDGTGVN